MACAPAATDKAQPNILLITVDTLRADHLSSYGYPRLTSPNIDKLAANGIRFDRPVVQWPKTGPSFASILTSTYPKDNGIVRKIGIRLPDRMRMLGEVLQRAGYATHAVVANGALASDFNFDQGFDSYIETWKLTAESPEIDPNGAEVVTQKAQQLIDGLVPGVPFFLWVHYLDPHFPYSPPQPWDEMFQGDEYYDPNIPIRVNRDRPRQQMAGIGFQQMLDDQEEMDFYVARYDAEIAYADASIGELLATLESKQLMENTLTAFTSDHGESLGEHQYFFDHGRFGFQTCLRVPLILNLPGVIPSAVDLNPVELIHLTPTILDIAGLYSSSEEGMQGRSLLPRILKKQAPAETQTHGFAEAGYELNRKWQRIVVADDWKLVFAQGGAAQRWIAGKGNSIALFNLTDDPEELVNLADEHPQQVRRLGQLLSEHWNRDPFDVLVDEGATEVQEEMDPETREQLKGLGYLQ
jgi:arylsulfatase A-like enzyme